MFTNYPPWAACSARKQYWEVAYQCDFETPMADCEFGHAELVGVYIHLRERAEGDRYSSINVGLCSQASIWKAASNIQVLPRPCIYIYKYLRWPDKKYMGRGAKFQVSRMNTSILRVPQAPSLSEEWNVECDTKILCMVKPAHSSLLSPALYKLKLFWLVSWLWHGHPQGLC